MNALKINQFRTVVLSAMFLFFGIGIQAQTSQGVLSFETESLDLGSIKQNQPATTAFTFKNTGDAPIVISKVKATCGCTVANFPEEAIMPGESAKIEVSYNAKKVGKFTKAVTVISNASEPNLVLKIKGEVMKTDS